jgi:hypothetical protein
MNSAIIHFGMHKTGSSSIQQSLAERLDDPGFRYVTTGVANSSGGIAIGFLDDPATYQGSRKTGMSGSQLEHRRQIIRQRLSAQLRSERSSGACTILSAEYISTMKSGDFTSLCDFFAEHGYAVTAVGYIRSPKSYMESAFQQRVQGGFNTFELSKVYPHYRYHFDKFDAILGRERVRFWHFDPRSFAGGCVVQDFCRRLGIAFPPANVVRTNEGLSRPAVSLLFAYRRFGPEFGVGPTVIRENLLLAQRFAQLRGPKLRFHSSLVAPILEEQRDDLAWMEERLGTSLSEDMTRDDGSAICSEGDLLVFVPEALQWLAEQLGPDYADKWRPDMSPQEVAEWVHLLRLKLAGSDAWIQRKRESSPLTHRKDMDIMEMVRRARESAPDLFEGMPDKAAAALLLEAFRQVGEAIESTDEGMVRVAGLGQFQVRQSERERDGTSTTVKRVMFRPESAKPQRPRKSEGTLPGEA